MSKFTVKQPIPNSTNEYNIDIPENVSSVLENIKDFSGMGIGNRKDGSQLYILAQILTRLDTIIELLQQNSDISEGLD